MSYCLECSGSGLKYLSDGIYIVCDCYDNSPEMWKEKFRETLHEITLLKK